ncbi:MAG TPA: hypothetical protein VKB26_15545 [Candidatus Acidoferrales bacterium]|nr:hypothetical protein [Candidatus Acidoferrales bacterium]
MSDRGKARRVVVFLCVAAVILAALAPGSSGLPLAFLVVTICFFGTISLNIPVPCVDEESSSQQILALATFCPRPPPAL